MTLHSRLPCPNCGKELELPAAAAKFVCKHCGEALRIAPDKKLFLLNPISRYGPAESQGIVSMPEHQGIDRRMEDSVPQRSIAELKSSRMEKRRRRASAEMAFERIALQKREAARFSRIGFGFLGLGILFLLVVLVRAGLGGAALLDVAIPALLILALVSFGFYFIIWSVIVTRSSSKEEEELRGELSILRGKVANDNAND